MKAKYLMVLLCMVTLPTVALVTVTLNTLHGHEEALRTRMDRHAGLVISMLADDVNRLMLAESELVAGEFEHLLRMNTPLELLEQHAKRIAAERRLADEVYIFMNPWGFIVPQSGQSGETTEAVRRALAVNPSVQHKRADVDKDSLLFTAFPERPGIFTGFMLNRPALLEELRMMLSPWQGLGFHLSLTRHGGGELLPADIDISEEWFGAPSSAAGGRPHIVTAPYLSRVLPWPLQDWILQAEPEDSAEILNTRAVQQRLRLWALIMLPLLITAGAFMVIHAAARDAALARDNSALLSGISHDLRTPLAAAVMMAETLERDHGADPERRKHCTRLLLNECRRLSLMVEKILSIVRMGNPAGRNVMATLDLAALAERVSGAPQCGPLPVRGNESMLEQVLRNLLENASQYGDGEVRVECAHATRWSLWRKREWAVMRVINNGAGIPAAEMRNIWKPFYRGSLGRARNTNGLGMGLSLCKRIIRWHGGRITAKSAPGRTVFEVGLRLQGSKGAG